MRSAPVIASLFLAVLLAACGGDDTGRAARRADGTTMDPLPAPAGVQGSVTGMPEAPGPGQPADNASLSTDAIAAIDEFGEPIIIDEEPDLLAEGEAETATDDANAEPTSEDAVAALQRYYAAIAARDFGTAYALWAEGGRASGQTPDQFAAGFADTVHLAPLFDAPVRVEGAVGSRYIEVPVAVESTSADGRVRRFVGAYVLRRSVVDGATDDQRAWRIASADLRELTQ
jgi:hypothetical protein